MADICDASSSNNSAILAGNESNATCVPPQRTFPLGTETIRYIHAQSVDELRIAVLVSFLVVFVLGSVGNSLVVYVIGRHSEIRVKSVANYYIWNLAIADLFFLLTVPFYCYATYTIDWPFGWFSCKVCVWDFFFRPWLVSWALWGQD